MLQTDTAKSKLTAIMLMTVFANFGCGEKVADQPKTFAVTGIVTYQGNPVEGALVSFAGAKAPRAALGTTDKAGKYVLSTFGTNDGAVVGEHKVMISKWQQSEFSKRQFASADENDRARAEAIAKGEQVDPKSLLPAKYGNPATSGLTATVSKDGKNNFDFTLTD